MANAIFQNDFIIGVLALVVFFPLVLHGYASGGPEIRHEFALKPRIGGASFELPGWFGDLGVALLVSIALWGVVTMIGHVPDPLRLAALLWMLPIYLLSVVIVRSHAAGEIALCKKRKGEASAVALARSYRLYNYYAAMLYTVIAFVAVKFIAYYWNGHIEFQVIVGAFAQSAQGVTARVGSDVSAADAIVIGQLAREYTAIAFDISSRLEPLAMITMFLIAVHVAIVVTPLHRAFAKGAIATGQNLSLLFAAVLFVVSLGVFYFEFEVLQASMETVLTSALSLPFAEIEALQYISDLADRVTRLKGISGFIRVFTDEGGLAITLIAAGQWALSKFMENGRAG